MAGPSECASVCEPIRQAQNCNGDTACTCTAAPPSTVKSCLECNISRRDGLQPQWISASSNARDSYSQLCNDIAPTVFADTPAPPPSSPSFDNTTTSDSPSSLSRRESPHNDDYCIYGFPVITWKFPEGAELSQTISDHNMLLGSFFFVAVAICILQNRRRSS
ncbi:hypothetical protein BC835DRAFT_678682 [Cytidiella melzeri]|nr:hypothetical protein BC835DRAFT_678682 [Cytidiella melzeri]